MGVYEATRGIRAAELVKVEGREAWLVERRNGVGGSDVGAILGRGFVSALTVWREKRGMQTAQELEASEEFGASEKAEFGHRMEDLAAAMWVESYGASLGLRVERLPEGLFRNSASPWMQASVDRIVLGDKDEGTGVMEIKNVDASQSPEWKSGALGRDGTAPAAYVDQILWYLQVLGLKWGVLVAVVGGSSLRVVFVDMDDEETARQAKQGRDAAQAFWVAVTLGEMPRLAGTAKDAKALSQREVDEGEAVEVSAELVEQVLEAKADLKRAEERMDLLKAEVQARMGGPGSAAQRAVWNGAKVAELRSSSRTNVDAKKLAKEYPDAYAACAETKATTAFYITAK